MSIEQQLKYLKWRYYISKGLLPICWLVSEIMTILLVLGVVVVLLNGFQFLETKDAPAVYLAVGMFTCLYILFRILDAKFLSSIKFLKKNYDEQRNRIYTLNQDQKHGVNKDE